MIHLLLKRDGCVVQEIRSPKNSLILGREKGDVIIKEDDRISRMHGEIFWSGSRCVYRDLLSSNGSMIRAGGQTIWLGPLMPDWPVNPGDEVLVGDTVIQLREARPEKTAVPLDRFQEPADEETQFYYRPAADGESAPTEIIRFNKFLQVLAYDPTDVRQVKQALCEAFRQVFPGADCVALVEVHSDKGKGELQRQHLDQEEAVAEPRDSPVLFSFNVLREACRRQVPVLFVNRPAQEFSEADSVIQGGMGSCLAAPLGRGTSISAFVHLYTKEENPIPFTPRDMQLLALLASVASVVFQSAKDAEERSIWRTLAMTGQVVAGLGHDAGKMMKTLGITAKGVEKGFPGVKDNASWQELRKDLEFLRFMARDILDTVQGKDLLEPHATSIHPVVEDAWDRCRRFFLPEAWAGRLQFSNSCGPTHEAWIDPMALTRVLMNCIKNSLDALHGAGGKAGNGSKTLRLVSSADLDEPDRFLALSICDDGGGIPPGVLTRLAAGRGFVSTKGRQGSGLGLKIVVDLVRRMHGQVFLASSVEPVNNFPAGTVISLRLPCMEVSNGSEPKPASQGLVVVPDYGTYRARIEGHLQEKEP